MVSDMYSNYLGRFTLLNLLPSENGGNESTRTRDLLRDRQAVLFKVIEVRCVRELLVRLGRDSAGF